MVFISFFFVTNPVFGLFFEPRVRITDVSVDKTMVNQIKINEPFNVSVNLTNQRRLIPAFTEIYVYLVKGGIITEEIGKSEYTLVRTKSLLRQNNNSINVPIQCVITNEEVSSLIETYGLKVKLFENRYGFLKKRDVFTYESIRIISEFWEKDKLKIEEFAPPEYWDPKTSLNKFYIQETEKFEQVNVVINNSGMTNFNVIVRIDLVEKSSIDIPLLEIEGLGDIRKEIGRNSTIIEANNYSILTVNCELRPADQDKNELDLQAILFVNIDERLYEVDRSTIQTVKINHWQDYLKTYGPWVWLVFIGAMGTILLVAVTVRVVWPLIKIKQKEVGDELSKIDGHSTKEKKKK